MVSEYPSLTFFNKFADENFVISILVLKRVKHNLPKTKIVEFANKIVPYEVALNELTYLALHHVFCLIIVSMIQLGLIFF